MTRIHTRPIPGQSVTALIESGVHPLLARLFLGAAA